MTEIEIFPKKAEGEQVDSKTQQVMAAVDRVAPRAMRMVAGNENDEQRVSQLVTGLRTEISRGGQVSAQRYLTQVGMAA